VVLALGRPKVRPAGVVPALWIGDREGRVRALDQHPAEGIDHALAAVGEGHRLRTLPPPAQKTQNHFPDQEFYPQRGPHFSLPRDPPPPSARTGRENRLSDGVRAAALRLP